MLKVSEIIEVQTDLEHSTEKTIESFMIDRFGYDYDESPLVNQLYQLLKDTMVRVETQHPNGYIMYSWIDK